MIRNIKAFGFALGAVLALSAVVAGTASAAKVEIEGGKALVTHQSTASHVFTIDGAEFVCKAYVASTEVEVSNGATTVTVHPIYAGCDMAGFTEATVTTTGCNYVVSAPGSEGAGMKFTGEMKLTCSGTNKIVIVSGTCEATISGPQTFSLGVSLENTTASPMSALLSVNSIAFATTKTKDGFLCPFSGTGAGSGTYSGNSTVRAFTSGGSQVGITMIN